ncbi:MAG: guanylate kinase [Nevskiaceae bacterium]|jgi:guanylate kinase|nr:guanylate kinase [Nevskiaceae bacterium]
MTAQLYVISAPSGAGKTSLIRALREKHPQLLLSTSHTTRAPRPNEQHGREYFFVDKSAFEQMIAAGEFLEHAQVFDNHYGTSQQQLKDKLASGADVVLEIDWQGARQVRRLLPASRSIFILPPSLEALRTRLTTRQTDSPEVIARRLADAVADMGHYREFDYVIVNDDFARALADLEKILAGQGEAWRSGRPELSGLAGDLLH